MQLPSQLGTDVADSLDGHPQAIEILPVQAVTHGAAHGAENAPGSEGGRVAGGTFPAEAADMLGGLCNHPHIGFARTGILGGDVVAVQRIDQPAHGAQQFRGLVATRVGDDHGLAAAQRQVGQRRLVGHAAGQAQHIGQCLIVTGVGEDAQAAQGRA